MKDPILPLVCAIIVTLLLVAGYQFGSGDSTYLKGYADGRAQAHQDIIDYCEHISQDL
jgi:hypothetical protein